MSTEHLAQDLGGVVRPEDLKFSDYPEATPRGMHVGLPKGVRAIHTPTGIEVACKHYRSQHLNRDACIRAIEAALTERTNSTEIAGALRDAERYRWLRDRLAGKEHIDELVEFNHDAHPELRTEVDAAIDSAIQKGGGGGE